MMGEAAHQRLVMSGVVGLLLAVVPAVAERFGDLQIVQVGMAPAERMHGYLDQRFQIENGSASQARTVRLVAPSRIYRDGDNIASLDRTVTVPPLSSVTVSVPQPPLDLGGPAEFFVYIDGRKQRDKVSGRAGTIQNRGWHGGNPGLVLWVSQRLNAETLQGRLWPESLTNKSSRSYGAREVTAVRADQPLTMWSPEWLSYSAFDGVVLTAAELATVRADVLTALWRHVTCGGTLIVFGDWVPPGALCVAPPVTREGVTRHAAGFGQCLIVPAVSSEMLTVVAAEHLLQQMRPAAVHWTDFSQKVNDIAMAMPVADSLGIPVRTIFWLVVIAALGIGPVNLWILARKKRQIWMLWTVPALSLATCIWVLVYALMSEGITPYFRMRTLTLLDERNTEAASIGHMGCYCPLTPGDGLRFSLNTEVDPLLVNRHQGGQGRRVVWAEDQVLGAGWVESRVPAYFGLRKPGLQRERLEVEMDGDNCRVVNGLGAHIKKVLLSDARGWVFEGTEIAPGAKMTLRRLPGRIGTPPHSDSLSGAFHGPWQSTFARHLEGVPSILQNSYVAILTDSPFVEPGLEGRANRKVESVVIGFPREPYL